MVRKVSPAGIITTVAGNFSSMASTNFLTEIYAGDGGPATAATLNTPGAVVLGSDGRYFVAVSMNCGCEHRAASALLAHQWQPASDSLAGAVASQRQADGISWLPRPESGILPAGSASAAAALSSACAALLCCAAGTIMHFHRRCPERKTGQMPHEAKLP